MSPVIRIAKPMTPKDDSAFALWSLSFCCLGASARPQRFTIGGTGTGPFFNRRLNDHRRSTGDFHPTGPPELDAFISARPGGTQIYQHHPIFRQIQNLPEFLLQSVKLHRTQFTTEHRILHRIPISAQLLVRLPQPLRLTNVVTDDVNVFHLRTPSVRTSLAMSSRTPTKKTQRVQKPGYAASSPRTTRDNNRA